MNSDSLVVQAENLKQQAHLVLERLNLLHILSKYGQPIIVGSVAMGLMTWPDIDIDLVTKGEINEEDFWQTARHLLAHPDITRITLVDNRQCQELNRPKSMYIGCQYKALRSLTWKLDIRFLSPKFAIAPSYLENMMANLTDCKKKAILSIKHTIAEDPRYRNKISSVDIYKAVMDKGITNMASFEAYLKEAGNTL